MNNKVLVAFLGGLIVASGITYFAMRKSEPVAVTPQSPAAIAAVPSSAPVAETKAPEAKEEPVAAPVPAPVTPSRVTPSKPSPGVQTARNVPQQTARPAPVQQPSTPPQYQPAPTQQTEVARAPEPAPPAAEPPPMPRIDPPTPKPNTVTIPAGTTLRIRLAETLSTERSHPGDTFSATLDQPLVVDGFVLAEKGSRAQGRVVEADRSGRVKGVALMQVELTQISTSDGQRVKVNTGFFEKKAESGKKQDAAKVGIGAALGAAIGAIAGGGKGAGIGAGVGGAAGAGDVLLTRGKPVELAVETQLSFRLSEPVTITERLRDRE